MKKNIIITSIISLLGMIIGFLFIYNSHKKIDLVKTSDFCVVHGSTFVFPFDIEVAKGTTYFEAVLKLKTTLSINHIYKKNGKTWNEVNFYDSIKFDSEIKVKE